MTLHKNTQRELMITHRGNRIIVETKQDIADKKLRKEYLDLFVKASVFLLGGMALGYLLGIN